jgi:hypothetical protein
MSFGLSAAAIGGIAAGVGAVGGAVISSQGAQSAANTQANAQQQAAADQLQMFNTINQQEQPFIQAGQGATTALQQLLGLAPGNPGGGLLNGYLTQTTGPFSFNPSSITSSPGYQFAQQQGLQAVANNQSASVGALSGPALKALTQFSTGTAAQYYNDYFNQAQSQYATNLNSLQSQQNNIFSRLSAIAGLGQNAASNTGTAGTALGTGASQAIAGAGASQAAGTVGSANALAGGLGGVGNAFALNSILSSNNLGANAGANPFDGTSPGINGFLAAGS